MQESKNDLSLHISTTDYVASATRGLIAQVPFVGSLFAEIAGTIIPNQRIDRIAKFAAQLAEDISDLEEDFVRSQVSNENFTDLLEDAIRQAARSVSDERRERIASLVAMSMTDEDVQYVESKHVLRILGEINDIEVIWLRYYLVGTMGGDEEFREKHVAVLAPIGDTLSSSDEEHSKASLQESYQDHLAQLGLIKRIYEADHDTHIPKLDFDGSLITRGYALTALGALFLRHIGLEE